MILRAALIACAGLLAGTGTVLAHALPGSALVLRQNDDVVQLRVQFPVEELIAAAPDLIALEDVPEGEALPDDLAQALAAYMASHLQIMDGALAVPLAFEGARVQSAFHDHVGQFAMIVTDWTFVSTAFDPADLVLRYDAIMHEVRNHRATVQWATADGALRRVGAYGYFDAGEGLRLGTP
ncbi:hypothetical protein [Sagittula sp. SSi028]|uniref:hypothetical protein n=1 Tax=Sagittula sp. SSi028 TaxID=3400636 RepID=UPI003AF9B1AD